MTYIVVVTVVMVVVAAAAAAAAVLFSQALFKEVFQFHNVNIW